MYFETLKAKIHRATVSHSHLDYLGSSTIDSDLMEAAGIRRHAKIDLVNVTNGALAGSGLIRGDQVARRLTRRAPDRIVDPGARHRRRSFATCATPTPQSLLPAPSQRAGTNWPPRFPHRRCHPPPGQLRGTPHRQHRQHSGTDQTLLTLRNVASEAVLTAHPKPPSAEPSPLHAARSHRTPRRTRFEGDRRSLSRPFIAAARRHGSGAGSGPSQPPDSSSAGSSDCRAARH
ncbi:aspartate 1-decarboxylase [Streptomyces monashensis]|uniref:aspartate 1-decarboxylase n=1 Tax=Streptomyces monashensis TaxID=1678012 RepID=UPI0009A0E0B0